MTGPFTDGPGGLFDGLDDPTPPAFGDDRLPGVLRRGHHLRQQRRIAYAVGSTCAVVLIAGTGIGLAGGAHDNGTPATPLSPQPSVSHTKKAHHPHHTKSPGTPAGGSQPGGPDKGGGHHPPKTCESTTPTASPTDAAPSPSESPADSLHPSPWWTNTPPADVEPTTSPTSTPAVTDCATPATPTPSDVPTPSETPTPTYSLPPLLSLA